MIEHLKKVKEVSGNTPPQLQEYYDLPFPADLQQYWEDFLELNKRRLRGESGENPLTFVEIDAWARLVDVKPTQFWLDVIDMLDQTWLTSQAKK